MTKLTEDRLFAINYFLNSAVTTTVTVARQFDKSTLPEPAEQRALLADFDATKGHAASIARLDTLLRASLAESASLVRCGFNLLCYGYGSKHQLIETAMRSLFSDRDMHVLSGFSETALHLGPVALLNTLIISIYRNSIGTAPALDSLFTTGTATRNSVLARTDALCKLLSLRASPALILIHQLDSPALRAPVVHDCLERLVATGRVSLVATVDNPNIASVFSKAQFERFNWIWTDCTTMVPYGAELNRYALAACTAMRALSSPRAAIIVLQSLTSNSRSIFKLLATFQLSLPEADVSALLNRLDEDEECDAESAISPIGMSYHALFQKCQENFVVTAEANFRTQLTEFTDHDLFKSMEGRDGSQILFIPFHHADLRQVIQEI